MLALYNLTGLPRPILNGATPGGWHQCRQICEQGVSLNRETFSYDESRFARVFAMVAEGRLSEADVEPTAERIAMHDGIELSHVLLED